MLGKWVVLVLLCVAVVADASEVELDVGDVSLRYDMPVGYVRASEESPPLFRYLESAMPPANRLVEAFYTPADVQIMLAGGGTAKDTYFMVQAIRSMERQTVSTADWRTIMSQATAEMGKVDINAEIDSDTARNQRMSEAAGKPVKMEFGKVATPQVYDQTDRGARFLMFIPVTVNIDGKPLTLSSVCAGAMLLVRNKPLMVYAYRAASTPTDIAAAKQELGTAVDALLALNASSAEVASSHGAKVGGGFDWGRVALKGVIGGGIGLLIGVIAMLRRRRKQTS
jgi:hypothetical protein